MLQSFSSDVAFRGLSSRPFGDASPCVLGKRTVIYGRNGSGKTSLTEALRLAGTSGRADQSILQARVITNDSLSTISLMPSTMPFRLFVYNRFYLQESLQLFLNGNGHASPIMQLGAENIKAEAELEGLRSYLTALQGRQTSVSAALRTIERDRETIEKEVKAEIISALAPVDAGYYNTTRFQVTQVRGLLDDLSACSLPVTEFDTELSAATGSVLEPVALQPPPQSLPAALHSKINEELLKATVDSVQLSRLTESSDLSEWIEDGLSLHDEGDLCEFCQSGTVTAAVLTSYRQHFSDALDSLRRRLRDAVSYLQSQRDVLNTWLLDLPNDTSFLPDFRDRAGNSLNATKASVARLNSKLDEAIIAVQRRLADPLNPRPEPDLLTAPFPEVEVGGILLVVSENKAACGSQTSRIKEARAAIERHFGAKRGIEYRSLSHRLLLAKRALSTLQQRTTRVNEKRLHIQQELQDVGRMANLIDTDLREHFGHAHLRVSVSTDSTGYVVTRSGRVASHLSEGERNAIAFIYFIRSLEEEGVDPAQTVVVIDDPVTSLDKESLFAAFSFARERTELFAQTIVLTHDYEFFRLNLIDLERRYGSSQKRIRQNDTAEKQMPEVSFLEIRAITQSAAESRHGEVRELPRSLVQHPNEYHFLFLHVAEASMGNSQEYLPLVGNAARRLLEGFLSFRAPDEPDFKKKADAVAVTASIDSALTGRIVRFLHSQSHREEPRPSAALNFPSIEAELVATLIFIHAADEPHFNAMCKAVDLDPAVLHRNLTTNPST